MKALSNYTVVYSTEEITYSMFEEEYMKPHHRKCIDGTITGCGKCVGYCRYEGHRGFLTKELRKRHDCLKKRCYYYIPRAKEPPRKSPFSEAAKYMFG